MTTPDAATPVFPSSDLAGHRAGDAAADPGADRIDHVRRPLPASRKVHVHGSLPGVSVPMREIALTNGECVTVYDTSGPYTDPAAIIDLHRGLETVRARWIAARVVHLRDRAPRQRPARRAQQARGRTAQLG